MGNESFLEQETNEEDISNSSNADTAAATTKEFTWNSENFLIANDGIVLCDGGGGILPKNKQQYEIIHLLPSSQQQHQPSQPSHMQPSLGLPMTDPTIVLEESTGLSIAAATSSIKFFSEKQIIPKIKKRPAHMLPHLSRHDSQRYSCPRCGKDYSQSKNMRRHYRLECGQEPKYPCSYCQLRFKRNNQLKNHINTRHFSKFDDDNVYVSS